MWPHIFLLWYSCLCYLSSAGQVQAVNPSGLPSNPSSSQETASEERNLTTLLVCEGGQANLSCPTGQHILIHLANFGRFSLQPCNPTLNLEINTQCHNDKTMPLLKTKCQGQQSCSVPVGVAFFGEPCAGSAKYLEANYQCIDGPTATTTTSTTTAQTTSATNVVEETSSTTVNKKSEIRPKEYCSSQSSRHILWPSNIRHGHLARLACPAGSRGQAEWMCSLSGQWHPSSGPDLSKCVSDWSRQLKQDLEEGGEDPLIRLETIREVHSHVRREQLLGGDLMDLVQTTSKAIKNFGKRPELELELAKLVVDTAGYLLRESQQEAWMDLPRQERRRIADLLVHAVEHALLLLFPLDKGRSELLIAEPTAMAEVAAVGAGEYDVPFPSMSLYRENLDSVVLPREVLQMGALDQANVMYTAYDNILGSYLTISEPTLADAFHNPTSSYQPMINSHKGSEFKTPHAVVSKVLSVSIVHKDSPQHKMQQKLSKPIMISFHTFAPDQAYSNPRCVWWDRSSMDWSSSGCALEWQNNTHTMCHCFHFAHYAVVMDLRMAAKGLDQQDADSRLPLVSDILITLALYAACVTTIFCLLACLTCLYWFSDSSCERVCIHKHLCLVLLVSEVLMLVGLSKTDNEVVCSILAGLLHYFLLSVLSWALLSCFQLYYSLVKKNLAPQPFSKPNRQLYFYCSGYGCPALLVLVSLYWNYPPGGYSARHYCWLATSNYIYIGMLAPAALILLGSTILLAMVLLLVCQASKLGYKPCKQKVTEDANIVNTARADFKSTAALVLLLALCCTFGILWLVRDGSSASWRVNQGMCMLFSSANAMLGLVILLGYVVFNQKLQKDYLKWLQVNDWVPECLRPTGPDHSNSSSTSSTSCHDASFPKLNSPTAYGSGPPSSSTHSTANSATCASSIDNSECLLINDTLNRPPTNLSHLLLPGQQYRSQVDSFGMGNNNEGTYDYATIAYGDLVPLEFQQHLSQYPGSNSNIRFQPTSNHNYPASHRSQPPQTSLTKSVRRVETPRVPPFSSASSSSGFESASSTGRTPYYQPFRTAPPNFPPPPPPPGHPDELEDEGSVTPTTGAYLPRHSLASSSNSTFIGGSQEGPGCQHSMMMNGQMVQLRRPLLMPYPCPASPTPSSVSRAVVRMDFSRQQPLYSEEIQEN